jgi:hypothetical protein
MIMLSALQVTSCGLGVGLVHFGSAGERRPCRLVAVALATPYSDHMSVVPISEASGHLDEVAGESAATGKVIYLTRDGRRLAAIVPVEVAAAIEAAEDAAHIAAAEAAMAEPGEDIPAEAVWAELGIADDE